MKKRIKYYGRYEKKDFIFNLGHGILPQTPVDNVKRCIEIVKNFKG